MKHLLLFCLLLLSCSSCKQLLMWKEGIHQPEQVTTEEITTFAKKWKKNPDSIYVFKDSTSYFSTLRDKETKAMFLGALVFSKEGLLKNYKDSTSCQWSAGSYVSKLKTDTTYFVDTSLRCESMLKHLVNLNGKPVVTSGIEQYDYIVLYGWATFLGKYNERLFCIDDAVLSNKAANIQVYSINMDVLRSWNLPKDQMIRFK
jgi:hypothetical protein